MRIGLSWCIDDITNRCGRRFTKGEEKRAIVPTGSPPKEILDDLGTAVGLHGRHFAGGAASTQQHPL